MPGVRAGSHKPKKYIDNLVPLLGTRDTMLFLDQKTVLGSAGANEENVGLGLRSLLRDETILVGGNFFYDTRFTENDARHHQLGFGIEGLTKWVDARTNFYFPVSGKKRVSKGLSHAFRSRSLIEVDRYEEPLTGFDYEAGVLIPRISDYCETRAFIGGYHYFPDPGASVAGIKGRFEIRPIRALTVGFEVKNDNYNDAEYFVEAFLSIPLDTMNVFRLRNPFAKSTSYFAYKKGIRPLRARMVDRIVRDIDIVARDITLDGDKVHDITYVDNSNTTGIADGTLTYPYTTIQSGVNNAVGDKWVYVKEGSSRYAENVVLSDETTLWGQGYNGGFRGINSSSTHPVVGGESGSLLAGDVITLGNNNSVMGLKIQYATSDGVSFTDNTTATGTISHTVISHNAANGINLLGNTGTIASFAIADNTISNNGSAAINMVSNSGEISNVTIRRNTLNNNVFDGIAFSQNMVANTGTLSNFTISDNTIKGHDCGISFYLNNGVVHDFTITNNHISECGWDGLNFWGNNGTISGFLVSHNKIINNDIDGIAIQGGTISDVTFLGNTVTGNKHEGVEIGAGGALTGINLGDGIAGGYNSIYDNKTALGLHYDFNNVYGANVNAQYNWWGQASGPAAGQTNGIVDTSNHLTSDPN
jgi:hypothetical protein